jgi:hypothetical protein
MISLTVLCLTDLKRAESVLKMIFTLLLEALDSLWHGHQARI